MEHLGRESAPTEPAPIPKATCRTKRFRTALDQPTLLRPPVSEPERCGSLSPVPAFQPRWLALRGSPVTDLRVHNEAASGQTLNDLANLIVRPVGIPFDQLRSCSAYGTVEHGEMNGASLLPKDGKHDIVPALRFCSSPFLGCVRWHRVVG